MSQTYHEGELLVQERTGESMAGERNGRIISNAIIRGATPFLAKQSMIILGSLDDRENVWASLLFGHPGFVSASDDQTVEIDLTRAALSPHDPLWTNLNVAARVGMLAIDLGKRRRVRINGHLVALDSGRARLQIEESYPNCPKYIQRRDLVIDWNEKAESALPSVAQTGKVLDDESRVFLEHSDTFFVASAHPDRGIDASHRGGNPGFVRVLDGETLRIPDYVGNSMYNTLGNFVVNPRAGLVFPDFEGGRSLQIIGRAEIRWDEVDPGNESGGTRRFWDFGVEEWRWSSLPVSAKWEVLDYSPHNPAPTDTDRSAR